MKQIFYCFLLGSMLNQVNGQDTLTTAIFPEGGNRFAIYVSLLEGEEVPFELFDTTKDYFNINLDTIRVAYPDTEVFKFTRDAAGGKDVPDSEFAFKASFGNGFFRRDSNRLNMVGFSPDDPNITTPIGFELSHPIAHFISPIKLGDEHHSMAYSVRDLGLIKLQIIIDARHEVCGYGSLRIPPHSTYDVLRVWRKFIYTVHTITILGDTSTTVDSLVTWEFYNNGVKNTVLRVDARPTGNDTIWHFDFFHEDLTTYSGKGSEQLSPDSKVDAKIIGSNLLLPKANFQTISLYDLNGRLVRCFKQNRSKIIPLGNIHKGIYLLKVTDDGGAFVGYNRLFAQ